jgi:hypothetical protein
MIVRRNENVNAPTMYGAARPVIIDAQSKDIVMALSSPTGRRVSPHRAVTLDETLSVNDAGGTMPAVATVISPSAVLATEVVTAPPKLDVGAVAATASWFVDQQAATASTVSQGVRVMAAYEAATQRAKERDERRAAKSKRAAKLAAGSVAAQLRRVERKKKRMDADWEDVAEDIARAEANIAAITAMRDEDAPRRERSAASQFPRMQLASPTRVFTAPYVAAQTVTAAAAAHPHAVPSHSRSVSPEPSRITDGSVGSIGGAGSGSIRSLRSRERARGDDSDVGVDEGAGTGLRQLSHASGAPHGSGSAARRRHAAGDRSTSPPNERRRVRLHGLDADDSVYSMPDSLLQDSQSHVASTLDADWPSMSMLSSMSLGGVSTKSIERPARRAVPALLGESEHRIRIAVEELKHAKKSKRGLPSKKVAPMM